jgi:hypothetical protein
MTPGAAATFTSSSRLKPSPIGHGQSVRQVYEDFDQALANTTGTETLAGCLKILDSSKRKGRLVGNTQKN